MSETTKCRDFLSGYCTGTTLDLGCGGDKIVPWAIGVDLETSYAHEGDNAINLRGDARNLYWFKDNTIDTVYSSHLLEDFANTEDVLREWTRVLKVEGNLVLWMPNEQAYREHCIKNKSVRNLHHSLEYFGKEHVKKCINELKNMKLVFETDIIYIYSFALVYKRIKQ